MDGDGLESIRPFESNRLFNKHKAQLEEYIRLGRTDVMERVSVNRSYAVARTVTGDEERITVLLEAAFNNYIIETATKKVLQGDPEIRYQKRYLLAFVRTAGEKTAPAGESETIQCPHCGANVEVIRSGKCEYCGSIVYREAHDWVLDELDAAQ